MWFDIIKSLTAEEADATRAYWPDEDIGKGINQRPFKKMSAKIISAYLLEKGMNHIFESNDIYEWAVKENEASKGENDRGIYDVIQVTSSGLGDKAEWDNRGLPTLPSITHSLNHVFVKPNKYSKIPYAVLIEEKKLGNVPTKYKRVR
tara:strand:+ start:319 stop:762 length:444 start_codon:yes stop_codon:yes gene_type:complete